MYEDYLAYLNNEIRALQISYLFSFCEEEKEKEPDEESRT